MLYLLNKQFMMVEVTIAFITGVISPITLLL